MRKRDGAGAAITPTAERFAKNSVVRFDRAIADAGGDIGRPWKSLDTLSVMAIRGSISENMRQAGERFHDVFRRAGLDELAASDPQRVPVQLSTARAWKRSGGGYEPARAEVMSAIAKLGGVQSPGGSCAWGVLGLEMSLREWALASAWTSSLRIDRKVASGILVTDLGILQAHWGL